MELQLDKQDRWVKNKYLESYKRRVMVVDNNCIFRRRISQSELCFEYYFTVLLRTTQKPNGIFFYGCKRN